MKRLKYRIIALPPIYSRSTYISRFQKFLITTSNFSTNQSCLSICCCFFPQNNRNGLNHHENSESIKQCGYWHFRAFGDGDCKEITVGDCPLKEEFVIETIVLPISAELCQELCYESSNCAVFQHSAENCTLLREDYRQDCETAGGPSVSKILAI